MQQLADDLAFGIKESRAAAGNSSSCRPRCSRWPRPSRPPPGSSSCATGAQHGRGPGRPGGGAAQLAPGRQAGDAPRVLALALVVMASCPTAEYALEGTPSMELLLQKHMQSGLLQSATPRHPSCKRCRPRATPDSSWWTPRESPTGTISVLARQPLAKRRFPWPPRCRFATRAGAEIERQATDVRVRHQASLDKAQDAIVERDLQHRIIYWNQGRSRLHGWSGSHRPRAPGRCPDVR